MAVVQEVNELSETERGAGGFGSTGIQQKTLDDNKENAKKNKTETA